MPMIPPPGDAAPQYEIEIKKDAQKALRKLPRDLRSRLDKVILNLATDPHPTGSTKLAGHDILYRVRVDDWRITYAVYDNVLLIVVIEVAARGGAYRNI